MNIPNYWLFYAITGGIDMFIGVILSIILLLDTFLVTKFYRHGLPCLDADSKTVEDTTKKKLRKLYAPPCHGSCFSQCDDGYTKTKCPDSCELITCAKCPEKHPEWLLLCKGGLCIGCDIDKYSTTFLDVSYARKEEAKAMGAKWNPIQRKWYIHSYAKNKAIVLAKFKEIKQ